MSLKFITERELTQVVNSPYSRCSAVVVEPTSEDFHSPYAQKSLADTNEVVLPTC